MPGYVMILLFTVFVIGFVVIVFKHRKTVSNTTRVIAVLLFIFWAATIFIPSLLFLIPPYTPTIKGRVVDAKTGKPLANINIKAGWKSGSVDSPSIYKTFSTKTDEAGNFYLPRTIKIPSFFAPPFIYMYRGIGIRAYNYDYRTNYRKIGVGREFETVTLAMELIKDDETYRQNIGTLLSGLANLSKKDQLTTEEKNFVIRGYRLFEKKFPQSRLNAQNLFDLAGIFDLFKRHSEAIDVYQELIQKYPTVNYAEYAVKEIERIKKNYHLIPEHGKGERR